MAIVSFHCSECSFHSSQDRNVIYKYKKTEADEPPPIQSTGWCHQCRDVATICIPHDQTLTLREEIESLRGKINEEEQKNNTRRLIFFKNSANLLSIRQWRNKIEQLKELVRQTHRPNKCLSCGSSDMEVISLSKTTNGRFTGVQHYCGGQILWSETRFSLGPGRESMDHTTWVVYYDWLGNILGKEKFSYWEPYPLKFDLSNVPPYKPKPDRVISRNPTTNEIDIKKSLFNLGMVLCSGLLMLAGWGYFLLIATYPASTLIITATLIVIIIVAWNFKKWRTAVATRAQKIFSAIRVKLPTKIEINIIRESRTNENKPGE